MQTGSQTDTSARTLVNRVPFDAPWRWLAAGWNDVWAAPRISLLYGALFAVLSAGLTLGLLLAGAQSLVPAMAGGFLLIGPIAAVGLYETSRRLESGESIRFRDILAVARRAPGQLYFFGGILAFAFLVWLQIALLLFMLVWGSRGLPPASQFVPELLFSGHGLLLLVAGSAVGGALALMVFAISVLTVPLLMTRRVDVVTAIATNLEAIMLNPRPMLLWAGLIATFMAAGIATCYVGLIVVFPLIGHATWHAYRDLIANTSTSSYL